MSMEKERNLQDFLAFYKESTERLTREAEGCNRSLRKDPNPFLKICREDLADLNSGGKMLRGVLIGLGYRIGGGGDIRYSDALAVAYELFQTGILIHDDIIDNASTRRGKFTIHERCKKRMAARSTRMLAEVDKPADVARSVALCVGDLGIYGANLKIAEAYASDPRFGEMLRYFDEVVINTIRGELLDVVLPYELQDGSYDEKKAKALLEKSVKDIYHLKTSCYSIIGPLHLGMMLAGAAEEEMKAMDRFADEIGIAYQIMDDILGIYADAGYLGKDVGSDIAEFKQTILWMYVRNNDPEATERLLRYYGRRHISEEDLKAVRDIFRESGALSYAQSVMEGCFDRALRILSRMRFVGEEDRRILKGFVAWCSGRKN